MHDTVLYLTCELIHPLHLLGVGASISDKVDVNILAQEIVHRSHLLDYEAGDIDKRGQLCSMVTGETFCLLNAVGAETLVEEVNVDLLRPGSGQHAGEANYQSSQGGHHVAAGESDYDYLVSTERNIIFTGMTILFVLKMINNNKRDFRYPILVHLG